jgi:hypothetical protein
VFDGKDPRKKTVSACYGITDAGQDARKTRFDWGNDPSPGGTDYCKKAYKDFNSVTVCLTLSFGDPEQGKERLSLSEKLTHLLHITWLVE